MKVSQAKRTLKMEHSIEQQLFHNLIDQYGKDSYKAAYARGFLAGLEEALSILENEDEEAEI